MSQLSLGAVAVHQAMLGLGAKQIFSVTLAGP